MQLRNHVEKDAFGNRWLCKPVVVEEYPDGSFTYTWERYPLVNDDRITLSELSSEVRLGVEWLQWACVHGHIPALDSNGLISREETLTAISRCMTVGLVPVWMD